MKTIILSFVFINIIIPLIGMGIEDNKENTETMYFKEYLETFTKKSLPLKLDRVTTFSYMSAMLSDTLATRIQNSPYPQISINYYKFIPQDLRSDAKALSFRSIFVFPEYNDMTSLIIALDKFRDFDGEQNLLKLYFITYNDVGQVISYIDLAGYNLDLWEEFATIDENRIIEITKYCYDDSIPSDPSYYNFEETKKRFRLDDKGNIVKLEEQKKIGYFKEKGVYGYTFVKGL